MSETVSKTFVFKKAVITGDSQNLYDFIKTATTRLNKAQQRQMETEAGADHRRLLNDWVFLGETKDVCAASFFSFTLNENKNAVVLTGDEKSFPIETLAPSRDSAHHQEFISGLVWIAVKENYIAVMTSQTFTFTALEDYFTWLFSQSLGKTITVQLNDPRSPKFSECDMSSVKRLQISNGLETKIHTTTSNNRAVRHQHFSPAGRGWDILKTLYKALGTNPPSMGATNEHAFDNVDIDVIISVRRPTIADGNQPDALERIANAFKDIENPPIKAVFKDGRTISLADYRVSKQFRIPSNNKIPIATEVCNMLNFWLRKQIQNIELANV